MKRRQKASSRGSQKRYKLAILALGILFSILLFGRIIQLVSSFNKPLDPQMEMSKGYVWDGASSINVVFAPVAPVAPVAPAQSEIAVVGFNPIEKKITILHISGKTYIDLPKGYGTWKVESIYKLGQEEKNPIGAQLLELSISKLLGLPIDGVVFFSDKDYETAERVIKEWRGNPFAKIAAFNKIRTNLTAVETIRLFTALAQVRSDKIESLNLEHSNITESKLLPDSTRVLGVNKIQLDLFVRSKMFDTSIRDEGSSIAVFNATTRSGIAQDAARVLTNLGGNVVLVANSDKKQDKSLVFFGNARVSTSSERRLVSIFSPSCLKEKCDGVDQKVSSSRAQINIVLGEDYFKKWYQR